MRRNLKALLLAAMAVGAMSAIGATAAQATEFDCAVNNCTITPTKDGTGTTAHHVFDAPGNGPITCESLAFKTTGLPAEGTNWHIFPSYEACPFLGQNAFVDTNECHYVFSSHGGMQIECTNGTLIEFGIPGCTGTIGSQTLTGITDSAKIGLTQTISANVTGVKVKMEGAACITEGEFTNGRYTTGNTLVTATNAAETEMVDVAWDTATSD